MAHKVQQISAPLKLQITLENMPLPVYRTVLVPEDINMLQLHFVVQLAMGWSNSHMFQFQDSDQWMEMAHLTVGVPNPFDIDGQWNEGDHREADKVSLKKLFLEEKGGKPFWYWYDFGDSWFHRLTFKKPTKKDLENFKGRPVCVGASGACPPEDSGGPSGYADFLEAITDKKHPEYREMREWAGIGVRKKYDPDFADVETINANLAVLPHRCEWKLIAEKYFDG